jgi:uncharacterized coiled-coil protein SlyX
MQTQIEEAIQKELKGIQEQVLKAINDALTSTDMQAHMSYETKISLVHLVSSIAILGFIAGSNFAVLQQAQLLSELTGKMIKIKEQYGSPKTL